jgi:hypothetical protein
VVLVDQAHTDLFDIAGNGNLSHGEPLPFHSL